MKFRFFLLMLLPICMVGCNDEMDSLVKGPSEVAESITQMTRSISPDSIYDGEPVEFEPTQDMIRLKELYAEMHSTQRRAPLNPSSTYDETLWGNYADPKSNMRYIYDSSKKIAFAYNEDEEYGDYVLDYYGIRDWVESLPKRSTSMMILQNYTIIGL